MNATKTQVFLVSGQMLEEAKGVQQLSPVIGQRVVIALDAKEAYEVLSESEPAFRPVGHSTLQDHEAAAAKLRATIKGDDTGWRLFVASSIAN